MKARGFLIMCVAALMLTMTLAAGLSQAQEPTGPTLQAGGMNATPLGAGFTYQGQLKQGGAPVDGVCDFRFSLWDASVGGAGGGPLARDAVNVVDGLFTVPDLDFGAGFFDGNARWLEIAVRCPAGSGAFTVLSPRQALTAVPYALYSKVAPWSGLAGMPPGFADGTDNDTLYTAGAGLTLTGSQFSVNTTAIQARVTGFCAPGSSIRAINQDGGVICEQDDAGSDYWALGGNTGTTPGTQFLGTTDNQALELKVNGVRGLRLEPTAQGPNLIGGYSQNFVRAGVLGATIAGGGGGISPNWITSDYGTVSGGANNLAGRWTNDADERPYATVGGGEVNRAYGAYATVGGGGSNEAGGRNATVGGGEDNSASAEHATIAGGWDNSASASMATIGGGSANEATGGASTVAGGFQNSANDASATVGGGFQNFATGKAATVPGGQGNSAAGMYSLAAGYHAKAIHPGSLVWADSTLGDFASTRNDQFRARASGGVDMVVGSGGFSVQPHATSPNIVAGHRENVVTAGVYGATISGGGETGVEAHRVTANFGTISGGTRNTVSSQVATVGGGKDNTASGWAATVGGGAENVASGLAATVGGGGAYRELTLYPNVASGTGSTVSGGQGNQASGDNATVAGGHRNSAAGNFAVVGGGTGNQADGNKSFIGAGDENETTALLAVIGGGHLNVAGDRATVGGGTQNRAEGIHATVGGGYSNIAIGEKSTTPGGSGARAQLYGQMAYASGFFANPGDAQSSVYVLRGQTNDATPRDLFLDGVGQYLIIPSGRAFSFDILVVGNTQNGISAGYRIQGIIENNSGAVSFVGQPTTTILGEDDGDWEAGIVADNTADALIVRVTGKAGQTIRWVATVRTAEVGW